MIEKIVTGIVLDKFPFEDEHLVKVLIESGKVLTLRAKGLNSLTSKNRVSLNIFNICEIEYFTSGVGNGGRLKRSNILKEFLNDDEHSFNVLGLMQRLLDVSKTYNGATYFAIRKILESLESNQYKFQDILALIIIILRQEGYKPVVDGCAKCGSNKNINGFSLYENGLVCDNHEESKKYEMNPNLLRKLIEINSINNPILCDDLFFDPDEVLILKSMYKMFLENQLGANLYLINKI